MRRIAIGILACTLGCANSASTEVVVCPSTRNAAIAVVLMDARTGAMAPFTDVKVVARSSAHTDSAFRSAIFGEDLSNKRNAIRMASGHPGTYDITVSSSQYETWEYRNFRTVNNLKCLATTDTIVALLRR